MRGPETERQEVVLKARRHNDDEGKGNYRDILHSKKCGRELDRQLETPPENRPRRLLILLIPS